MAIQYPETVFESMLVSHETPHYSLYGISQSRPLSTFSTLMYTRYGEQARCRCMQQATHG